MTKTFCDACGKVISSENKAVWVRTNKTTNEVGASNDIKQFDMCPECKVKFFQELDNCIEGFLEYSREVGK